MDTYVAVVNTRDGDERAGRAAAAVDDVDLTAGDLHPNTVSTISIHIHTFPPNPPHPRQTAAHVELRTAERLRDMQGDRLHADEVLSAREVLRDGERDSRNALGGERDRAPAVRLGRDLVHLEPHLAVAREAADVPGRLRHVDVHDTGVVDRAVGHDAEGAARGDGGRLGRRARLRVVAAEVRGGDIGDGSLAVEVVRLPDVHPIWGRRAVYDERGEGVCKRSGYVSTGWKRMSKVRDSQCAVADAARARAMMTLNIVEEAEERCCSLASWFRLLLYQFSDSTLTDVHDAYVCLCLRKCDS